MGHAEQTMQIAVFTQLRALMHLQNYSKFMAFQIRNETGVGGSKGQMIGKFAKAMGTMEGASDTLFLFPKTRRIFTDGGSPTAQRNFEKSLVFVEYKADKPLKKGLRDPITLLSPAQKLFKERVEGLGFDYHVIAAFDIPDALKQTYAMMESYGAKL